MKVLTYVPFRTRIDFGLPVGKKTTKIKWLNKPIYCIIHSYVLIIKLIQLNKLIIKYYTDKNHVPQLTLHSVFPFSLQIVMENRP